MKSSSLLPGLIAGIVLGLALWLGSGSLWRVKGQNVCLARRVAGVRFGLFEC
ncbi:hypothetical protein HMPREF1264_01412, partial [Corynebacterium sp. KPL1821]